MEAVNYLDWEDFLLVAAEATDLDVDQVGFIANRQLAESALGAPASGFGDCEQYPKFRYKVAILLERICKNHALRDGNKRTALLAAIHFANINGWEWVPPIADQQDGAETYEVVSAVAQSNVDIDALADWVGERLCPLFGIFDQAEEFPQGREEHWRGRLVGRYQYLDGHLMTSEDFQDVWADGRFPGTDQSFEEVESYERGAIAYVTAWLDAVLKLNRFDLAWALLDDVYRLAIAQEWIDANKEVALISVLDRDQLAHTLASPECLEHFLWPQFSALQLAVTHKVFKDHSLSGLSFSTRPRPSYPGHEIVALSSGKNPRTVAAGEPAEIVFVFLVKYVSYEDGWRIVNINSDTIPTPGWPPTLR